MQELFSRDCIYLNECSWFLPRCQTQIQGLFKDFQGPYEGYSRRTALTKNSTFISMYKKVQFTFHKLTLSSIKKTGVVINSYQIRGAGSKLKVEGHKFISEKKLLIVIG